MYSLTKPNKRWLRKAAALILSCVLAIFQVQPLWAEDTNLLNTQSQTTIEAINSTQNLTTAEVTQNALIQQNIDAQNSVQPPTLAELASSTALSQDTINTIINNVAAVGMDRQITYMTTNENQARYEAFIRSLSGGLYDKTGGLDYVKGLIAAIKADPNYKVDGATTTTLSGWVNSNTNSLINSLFFNNYYGNTTYRPAAMDDYLVRFIKENLVDAEAITNSLTKTGAAILKDKARGNVYSLYTVNGKIRYMRAEAGYWGSNSMTGMYQLYTHYGANNETLVVFYDPTKKSASYNISGGTSGLGVSMRNVANPFNILGNVAAFFSGYDYVYDYDRFSSLLSTAADTLYTNMATYTGVLKVAPTTTSSTGSTSTTSNTSGTPTLLGTTNTSSTPTTSGAASVSRNNTVIPTGMAVVIEEDGSGRRTTHVFQLGRIVSRTIEYVAPVSIWVADTMSSIGKLFDDAIKRAADVIRNLTNREASSPTANKADNAIKSSSSILEGMKDIGLKATMMFAAALGAAASYVNHTLANMGRALVSVMEGIFPSDGSQSKGGILKGLFGEDKGAIAAIIRLSVVSQFENLKGIASQFLEKIIGASKPLLKESGTDLADDMKNAKINKLIQSILQGEHVVIAQNHTAESLNQDNSAVKRSGDSISQRVATASSNVASRVSDAISSTFTLQEDGNASSSFKKPVAVKMSEIVAVMGSKKPGLHGNNMLFLLPVAIRFGEKLIKRVFVVTGTLG